MTRPGSDQEAGRERLGHRIGARAVRDLRGVAALADHGCALERAAGRGRERIGAQQHRVEQRLRKCGGERVRMLDARRERRRQLLHVERDAVRALVQHGHDVIVQRLPGDRLGEPRGVLALERAQRDLDRLADPAQLRAQAAQPVGVGRHLVARERDEQQRHLAEAGGEVRQQQQRRLVGPVEIVEDDRDGAVRGHLRERAPQRLDQRGLAGVERRDPELGQQRREVRRQRPAGLGDVGRLAQALAQHLGDRVVGLCDGRARGAAVGGEPGLPQRRAREPRLADARLTRDEHAGADAVLDRGTRGLEGGELRAPADHRPALQHTPSVGRATGRENPSGRCTAGTRGEYGSAAHAPGLPAS